MAPRFAFQILLKEELYTVTRPMSAYGT